MTARASRDAVPSHQDRLVNPVTATSPDGSEPGVFRQLVTISKPRLSSLVLVTATVGMLIGPMPPAWPSAWAVALLTALLVATANALNCYLERDIDAHMTRTRRRPLPAGTLSPTIALIYAVGGGILATFGLWLVSNTATAVLGALGYLSYVAIYTPLKRVTPWALVVGAVPGAIPPAMGWAAAEGALDAGGISLFMLLFVWQIPHFLAIAVCEKDQYANAGIRVLPVVAGLDATYRATRISAWLAAIAMLSPWLVGLAGPFYGVTAAMLSLHLIFVTWRAPEATESPLPWARRIFRASVIHLTCLMVVILLDHT